MIPYLLAVAGGYLIGSSQEKELFAKGGGVGGGEIMKRNEIISSINYKELFDFLKREGMLSKTYNLEELREKSIKFIDKIIGMFNNDNTITIYREMMVDKEWLKDLMNGKKHKLGKWWAYDKNKAESWDYSSEINPKASELIILCAKTNISNIYWLATLEKYFTFGEEESESELALKLDNNITVELIYVEINGDKLYWDEFEDNKYLLKEGGSIDDARNN